MATRGTRRDYEDFLLILYFGPDALTEPMKAIVRRAYLDFARTIHATRQQGDPYNKGATSLRADLEVLRNSPSSTEQDSFDQWHERTCESLKNAYAHAGYSDFTVGQAQKWTNMTFKYIYTFGPHRLSGFDSFYEYCHVPIDNIMMAIIYIATAIYWWYAASQLGGSHVDRRQPDFPQSRSRSRMA